MVRRSSLRASDADREQVAERLRHAAAEGRLLAEELEQRLASALRARTYAELDPLVADLPGERRALVHRGGVAPAVKIAGAAVLLVLALGVLAVAAVLAVELFFAWGMWLLVLWFVFARRRYGRRRRGPYRHVTYAHRRTLL